MQHQNPQNQNTHMARPGAINYVEGEAAIDGQPLNPDAVGSVELQKGQVLTTQAGKVEILLTPGVFLRVADNSALKMVSPDLANTEVELDKGRAMVEVTDISKNNNIRVDQNGASTQLLKKGLCDFDADHSQVRVFKGKADVFVNNQKIGLGDNRELTLTAGGKLKAQSFDERQHTDNFYRWSGLRAGYLAEADADTARLYVNGGVGWNGSGWYWDPWFSAYTFIPGDGIFYSPFGWASTRPSRFMVPRFFLLWRILWLWPPSSLR
jgi:FecR protein